MPPEYRPTIQWDDVRLALPDADLTIRRVRDSLTAVADASRIWEVSLAEWERELLYGTPDGDAAHDGARPARQNEVGNPNPVNQEGEQMPTNETQQVTIPASRQLRRTVFDRLRLADALLTELDMQVWEGQMERLREFEASAALAVGVGNYSIGENPRIEFPDNTNARVDWLPLETAKEITALASGGRVQMTPHPSSPDYYNVVPTNALEAAAFARYAGLGVNIHVETYEGDVSVFISNLRDGLEYYRAFRSNRDVHRSYLREAVQARMNTNVIVKTPPRGWDGDRQAAYKKFFKGIKANLVRSENPFLDIPMLPKGTLSSRRWGIEIEAVDIEGVQTPEFWSLKGDGSLRGLEVASDPADGMSDHTEQCASSTQESDCSCGECFLECDCGYELQQQALYGNAPMTRTGEWVSPILRSYHSRGLKYLGDQLETRRTNTTPGVHVHVEASDLTPAQVAQVGVIYTALEPLFEKEYKREARSYCKSLPMDEIIGRFRESDRLKGIPDATARQFNASDRYWTVNVASLSRHGTIEFRAMGPRYNYEHLTRWAHFVREVVNLAKNNVPQKAWASVKTFRDVVVLFSKYGKETPTPQWAGAEKSPDLIKQMIGSENRRVPNQSATKDVFDDYTLVTTRYVGDAVVR